MTDMPRFEGLWPGMAEWWQAHLDEAPLVVIRCGLVIIHAERREPRCRNTIGEVKRDDHWTLAMSKNEHPEPEVPWTPLAAPTVEELEAEIAERERQVIRYYGTGEDRTIVYKRRPNLPRAVAPIEHLSYYSCSEHGEIQIDRDDLAAFVAASDEREAAWRETREGVDADTPTPKWTYWAHRDLD